MSIPNWGSKFHVMELMGGYQDWVQNYVDRGFEGSEGAAGRVGRIAALN